MAAVGRSSGSSVSGERPEAADKQIIVVICREKVVLEVPVPMWCWWGPVVPLAWCPEEWALGTQASTTTVALPSWPKVQATTRHQVVPDCDAYSWSADGLESEGQGEELEVGGAAGLHAGTYCLNLDPPEDDISDDAGTSGHSACSRQPAAVAMPAPTRVNRATKWAARRFVLWSAVGALVFTSIVAALSLFAGSGPGVASLPLPASPAPPTLPAGEAHVAKYEEMSSVPPLVKGGKGKAQQRTASDMEEPVPLWFMEAMDLFKDTDRDGNGFLSGAELRALSDGKEQQVLADADSNGDALLDEDEFARFARRQWRA